MNAIIASSEYSNEEKKVALENIESRKKLKELEKKTVNELKELGYTQLFMEVAKTDIFVIVKYPEFTNLDASGFIFSDFFIIILYFFILKIS